MARDNGPQTGQAFIMAFAPASVSVSLRSHDDALLRAVHRVAGLSLRVLNQVDETADRLGEVREAVLARRGRRRRLLDDF